jgi:hypothetical protein
VFPDKLVQREALDPLHLEDGIPVATHPNASIEKSESHHEGELHLFQVDANLLVALAQPRNLPGEALDRPGAVGCRAIDLVDVGEVAGAGRGHAQGIGYRFPAAQFRVREAAVGDLNRLVVILRERPGHEQNPSG